MLKSVPLLNVIGKSTPGGRSFREIALELILSGVVLTFKWFAPESEFFRLSQKALGSGGPNLDNYIMV